MAELFDYDDAAETALELILEFGQPATLTRTETIGDPWDAIEGESSTYAVTIAVLPASKGTVEAFDIRLDENLIMANLRFAYMAVQMVKVEGTGPDEITPYPGDILRYGETAVTLLGSTPLNPAGTPVYYPVAGRI